MIQPPSDPYRDWLRARLSAELGVSEAEQVIQGAVQRRGWTAMRALGPRDVVAALQDVYSRMRDEYGDARADRWLEGTTLDLARFAETVPVPAQPTEGPIAPAPGPVRWGRRAHDLPLLLARSHAEIAGRSLAAIRANPELRALERAAEWDVQATQAEVRRWETEEMLSRLRADHARIEVADQVAAAAAQAQLLDLNVRELSGALRSGQAVGPRLAHTQLMASQTRAFLDAFTPLIDLGDADTPLTMLDVDLANARFSLGVPLHPNVLRARQALNYAQWHAGETAETSPAVAQARQALRVAEEEARGQLDTTLQAARSHQAALRDLKTQVETLERRATQLAQLGGDPVSLARVRLEWRQARTAARVQAHRLEEALKLLDALVSEGDTTSTPAP
ncbi:hypothetical protein GCM10008956_08210 [Deinococcus arenae]|uniref:Uncharacterized protein n=1 Tax=Deinococcus arenae TaxID=1452751 RepID=A0A8H9GKA0_9DEIO|nr:MULTISPECIES: hypothetical protein [Deinococcus]AWT37115.1 hypothetical protein DM785_08015 [Deinococcus actinosclerus]GGM34223.1 hypothetical protein GCM10008956_08210 [Deinococcus arenae]